MWTPSGAQLSASLPYRPLREGNFPKSFQAAMGAQQAHGLHYNLATMLPSSCAAFPFSFGAALLRYNSHTSQLYYTFQADGSGVASTFTRLSNHHRDQFYSFASPQKETVPLLASPPAPHPPVPGRGNRQPVFCLYGLAYSGHGVLNGITQSVCVCVTGLFCFGFIFSRLVHVTACSDISFLLIAE